MTALTCSQNDGTWTTGTTRWFQEQIQCMNTHILQNTSIWTYSELYIHADLRCLLHPTALLCNDATYHANRSVFQASEAEVISTILMPVYTFELLASLSNAD